MGVDYRRVPGPNQARDDENHAAIFLVALLLLIVVAAVLYFGNAWVFSSAVRLGRTAAATTPISHRTSPLALMVFAAPTATPQLAGMAIQPVVSAPAIRVSNAAPTALPSTSVMSSQVVTPIPTVSLSGIAHVGNTGGDGAFLRHSPKLADTWIAWPDRTTLTVTGAEADADGQHWLQVEDPKHNIGWIPAKYVVQ